MKTVVHFTDSRALGGTEQVLLQLLAGVDRHSWNPVLFHHPEPGIEPLLQRARRLRVATRSVPRMETFRDIQRIPIFVRALRAEGASVLHAHLTWPLSCKYGIIAAFLARVPVVIATAHLLMDLSRRRVLQMQPRLIATCVDRYLAVSQAVAAQLRQEFGIPAAKVRCINNGIPLASFNRPLNAGLRATLSRGSARPIVLTVASLESRKGQKHLIEAATEVPQAMFVLVGDGPNRGALEGQARALGVEDRVLFLGYREDVPDLLSCCDIFVLPSFEEGLPLSILEAMAAGKPVIASAIGGNDEAVVHGHTGLLVPPGNSAALAAAIKLLLVDSALARTLGGNGTARAREQYSGETMVRRTTQAYEELLGSRQVAQRE